MRKKTSLRPAFLAVAFILLAPLNSASWDREFGAVVRHIHATYHGHRTDRFLFWFAGVVLKFWHPYGVKSLRIALFEDLNFNGAGSDDRMNVIMSQPLLHNWQPLVRVWSRRDKEFVYIYARERDKDTEFFIVTLDEDEAVVLKTKFDPNRLSKLIANEGDDIGRKVSRKLNRREGVSPSVAEGFPQLLPLALIRPQALWSAEACFPF